VRAEAAPEGLRHVVLFHRGIADYRSAIASFVRTGLASREPVLLAVPRPAITLPEWPAGASRLLTVTDMADLGRNPARLISALRAFIERCGGRRARIVSEWIWPGRPAAEACEAARADALVDLALSGLAATLMCPFNAAGLPGPVLADAARAHRWRLDDATVVRCRDFGGPDTAPAAGRLPLPSPPAGAGCVSYATDLRPLRAMVSKACHDAGMPVLRATDMTLAVSELAANTLRHTAAGGTAHLWRAGGELVCQIADSGHIADPLAGSVRPAPGHAGGQGLWLVNQVCDLVEIRTGPAGTVIRLHMRIQAG